jgi:hypothetical protein
MNSPATTAGNGHKVTLYFDGIMGLNKITSGRQ